MKQRHHGVRAGRAQRALLAAAALGLLAGCTSFSSSHEKRADAQLQPTVGSQARGAVTFVERPDGVQVTYNLVGLPPNSDHALQVHERGDCNAGDGSSAGQVFAPARASPAISATSMRMRTASRPASSSHPIWPSMACARR